MSFDLRRLVPADLAADPSGRGGYWAYLGHLWTIWALALSYAFLGLSLLWTWRHRREIAWRWPRNAVLLVPLVLYYLFTVVSVVYSVEPAVSFEKLRDVFSLSALALALWLVGGERDVRRIVDGLVVMIALLAAYGLFQYTFTDQGDLFHRIRGPFSHYQTFAGVLLLGDFLLLARLVSGRGARNAWTWIALAVVNWTLLLTLTRGPWVALAVTFTAYLLVRARRYVAVWVAAVLCLVLLVPAAWGRMRSILDLREESNYDRLCMLDAGFYMISERPLFGLGPKMVHQRYPIYRHPTAPRFNVPHLHNLFVSLAAERGLTTLASYFWLIGAGLWVAYRAYRREGGPRGPRADLYLGVILAMVGFNVAGLFEDNWQDTEVQRILLFLLATPLALGGGPGETPGEGATR